MFSITHIINPFSAKVGSELDRVQPVTIKSLGNALNYARNNTNIKIVGCIQHDDPYKLPNFILPGKKITRHIGDVNSSCKGRPLPLLRDIIDSGVTAHKADYYVYTNIDIAVLPHFYASIEAHISSGLDAFVVNRRRVSETYDDLKKTDMMYAEVGLLHNGYDCFVFSHDVYEQMTLGDVCIGIPHVGNTLFYNLMAASKRFKLFTELNINQHIGYDLVKTWGEKAYMKHNRVIFKQTVKQLTPLIDIAQFPGSGYWLFKRHFKWLMNPTIDYPSIAKHDIKHLGVKRPKIKAQGISGWRYRFYEFLQKKVKLN